MKKITILLSLICCISLCISCEEEINPKYVFPELETIPTVTVVPVEKGTDFITFTIKTSYALEAAYLLKEGVASPHTAAVILQTGTAIEPNTETEVKFTDLKPATEYTLYAAVKDAAQSIASAPQTIITTSDAPESNYPKRMKVEPFEITFSNGDVAKGYIATAELNANTALRFCPTLLDPAQTPTGAFTHFSTLNLGVPYVVTNAGYFWNGASLSLCVSDGEVKSIATELAYPNNAAGDQIVAYPVRAALGQMADGSFEATWVYCIGGKPYSFPSPLDNDERTHSFMSSAPTASTAGAKLWEPKQAIGGGPMLVYKRKNVAMDYYYREIMDTGGTAGTSRQPRTAVGATKEGKVMIVVCDGRGSNGSKGLTISELADIFVEAGMDYAINLDGGGSSAMVGFDGALLNAPSDGAERGVPTVLVLSEKQ